MHVDQLDLSFRVATCAWCEPHPPTGEVGALSHGICPRHFRKLVLESQGKLPNRRRAAHSIRDESNQGTLLPF